MIFQRMKKEKRKNGKEEEEERRGWGKRGMGLATISYPYSFKTSINSPMGHLAPLSNCPGANPV